MQVTKDTNTIRYNTTLKKMLSQEFLKFRRIWLVEIRRIWLVEKKNHIKKKVKYFCSAASSKSF